jgi:hypothetical protein
LLLIKAFRHLKKLYLEIPVEVKRQHDVDRLRNQISLLSSLLTSVFGDQLEHPIAQLIPIEN